MSKKQNITLSYVTDKNLYKEFINYLSITFPGKEKILQDKLIFENGVMKGSTPRIAVAFNTFLKSMNYEYELSTIFDLKKKYYFTEGTSNDLGLVLRQVNNQNREEAKNLEKQLKKREDFKNNFPVWINLKGLELNKNLYFLLTDESTYKTGECLKWNNGTKFSKLGIFGLPTKRDKLGKREIWNANPYLARGILNTESNIVTYNYDLNQSLMENRILLTKKH